jgi:CSLREA domain-containing protein
MFALVLPGSALAAIQVTTTADEIAADGACSLREAVSAANNGDAGPGGDCTGAQAGANTITLTARAPSGYTLTIPNAGPAGEDSNATGDLDVGGSGKLTISGVGADVTYIDGGGIDRVIDVLPGKSAELQNLVVTGGHAPDGANGAPNVTGSDGGSGGGVRNAGSLTLNKVGVDLSRAGDGGNGGAGAPGVAPGDDSVGRDGGSGGNGGAIFNSGTLVVTDCGLSANHAGNGGDGGDATAASAGTGSGQGGDSLGGSGGSGGGGGAIYSSSGSVTVTRATIFGDSAGASGDGGDGGAAGGGGTNPAGQGGNGGASVAGGSVRGGDGGGIALTGGDLTVTDSPISANQAGDGGDGGAGGSGGDGGLGDLPAHRGTGGNSSGGAGGDGGGYAGLALLSGSPEISGTEIGANRAGAGGQGGSAGQGGVGAGTAATTGGGAGGAGGLGAGAGATSPSTPAFTNVTIDNNHPGDGGAGGFGGSGPGTTTSGAGGAGGFGGFTSGNSSAVTFVHATVTSNFIGSGGSAGAAGGGSSNLQGSAGAVGVVGGIQSGAASVGLRNTIVANNSASQCGGTFNAAQSGGNLEYPSSASCQGADITDNPLLGLPDDHGGRTWTMELGAGSPAIDAVSSGCAATDQRGVARPKGSACDIGALEKSLPTATTGAASAITASGATLGGTVDTGQVPTAITFDYGTTTAYTSQTTGQAAGSGGGNTSVSAPVSGLAPNTTYHYRLVAHNSDGDAAGADATFTTARAAFPGVAIVTRNGRLDRKRHVKVKLSCPAAAFTKDTCSGTLTLRAKLGQGKKARTQRIARKTFRLAAGKSATLTVTVSKGAAATAKSKKKLKAGATTSATDARGGTLIVKAVTLTLKPPKAKSRH